MSLNRFRKGQRFKSGAGEFLMLQRLPDSRWQLQNCATGEWSALAEDDLLDSFAQGEVSFVVECHTSGGAPESKAARHLAAYSPELATLAGTREQYLKEIDRHQPIAITKASMGPLIRSVSERIHDGKTPGWLTLWRDYRKWLAAGRDVRAIIPRYADRGKHGPRLLPEVRIVSERVIDELYMTPERKRVPEVHLEIVRRLGEANQLRAEGDRLPIPSRRTIYREIARRSPYEMMAARYGKRRAEMEFRVSATGPETSRALQRVSMDHTPSDIIGYTMKIIRGAARIARCHPRRQITLGTLSEAFAEQVWSERLDDPNPFVDSFDCDKAPPITPPGARTFYVPPGAPGNRGVRLELQA